MPLSTFSGLERAKEIYETEKKKVEEEFKKGLYPPGLKEQYDVLFELLDPEKEKADIELVGFPGYFSFPKREFQGPSYCLDVEP
jgi:hypothetical protein